MVNNAPPLLACWPWFLVEPFVLKGFFCCQAVVGIVGEEFAE